MEQDITLKDFLKEILEPIIDESLDRAMNKYINTMTFETKDDSGVLNMNEAAVYLKISKQTLYGMTSKRVLPHYKHGHRIYFRKAELDDWINKGKVKTREEIEEESSSYIARRRNR
jgi:excisionase family DNA binding protein